ncbi:MAG: MnmC family methyltransferase, partial [Gammaproteobacteria bacterium]
VSLQLIVCQAENLAECITASHSYDVVFMDGFSPANNPEMWSLSLCQQLYTMTKKSATLSTFTVAGQVKRHLKQAGFDIKKVPGFGKKREMLTANKC